MAFTYSALESRFRLGLFQEILDDLESYADGFDSVPLECRVVFADTLQRTGRIDPARKAALSIASASLTTAGRARCEMVLGLVSRDTGHMDEAVRRLQSSERLAREHGLIAQAGLSSVLLFRIYSERQSQDVARPMLAGVRRLVIQAGDPHLTALLHETVARQETQAGNFDEARRHLRIATRLIETHPNAWLEQYCALNAFCLEFYTCDLKRAQEHLEHARSLTSLTGSLQAAVANNEGHLFLQQGDLDRAERMLLRVIDSGHGEPLQSALEGLARLYLVSDRLPECEVQLNRLHALLGRDGMSTSFPYRASLITRIRLRLQH